MENDENNVVIGNIEAISNGDNFGLKSTSSPFAESFYFEDFYDDKAIKKFIKNVEKMIRGSKEYRTYIEMLHNNVFALNHDNILSNITTSDVEIEFHHYPFSLYNIVEVVMLDHIQSNVHFTSFSLAKEIMQLHYRHIIGLVPLTKTTHEMAHSGNLFLSQKQVFGDYHTFMTEYKNGVTVEMQRKISTMETLSQQGIPSDFKGVFQ